MKAYVAIAERAALKPRQIALIEEAAPGGCWTWRGCKNSGGYAVVSRSADGLAAKRERRRAT